MRLRRVRVMQWRGKVDVAKQCTRKDKIKMRDGTSKEMDLQNKGAL